MKTVKSLLVAASLVVLSLPVTASSLVPGSKYSVETNSRTLVSQENNSKEDAYATGKKMLDELKHSQPSELRSVLNVSTFQPKELASLQLKDNSYVTVEESMNTDGNIEYRALVNVQYQHLRYDNN